MNKGLVWHVGMWVILEVPLVSFQKWGAFKITIGFVISHY